MLGTLYAFHPLLCQKVPYMIYMILRDFVHGFIKSKICDFCEITHDRISCLTLRFLAFLAFNFKMLLGRKPALKNINVQKSASKANETTILFVTLMKLCKLVVPSVFVDVVTPTPVVNGWKIPS